MLTYVVELHCDRPGCENYLELGDGPTLDPDAEAGALLAKAAREDWGFDSCTGFLCPACRKNASGGSGGAE